MRSPSFCFHLIILLTALLLSGCDLESANEKNDGAVSVSIERTESVPPDADSALVRVWMGADSGENPDFDKVSFVEVPERSGQKNEVSFEAPVGTGYQAAVLLLETDGFDPTKRKPRATGYSAGLDVRSDDTTSADITVDLVEATLEHPSTVDRGDTLEASVIANPPGMPKTSQIEAWLNDREDFAVPAIDLLRAGEASRTNSMVAQRLEVEQLPAFTDTIYVKVRLDAGGFLVDWLDQSSSLNLRAFQLQPIDLPVDNMKVSGGSESFAIPCCADQ